MNKKHFTKPLIATCCAILFAAGAYLVDMQSAMAEAEDSPDSSSDSHHGRLPVKKIQEIIQAEGHVDNGVLNIEIARKDIGDVKGPQKDKKAVVEVPDHPFEHGDK